MLGADRERRMTENTVYTVPNGQLAEMAPVRCSSLYKLCNDKMIH